MDKQYRTGQETDDNIKRRMRIACRIIKATNTHSEYVIFIAFPLQKWLKESAPMFFYMYSACIINHAALQTESAITWKCQIN